jgi:alkaline phosphatase
MHLRIDLRRGLWNSLVAVLVCLLPAVAAAAPRNIVLLIGDGMGFEHLKAASLYAYGAEGRLFLQQLPVKGECSTDPAGGKAVPDSANTATALATGVKVSPGVISVRIPGDGKDLPTLLEKLAAEGKRTGLVTTVGMGDATPAGFAAHARSRKLYDEIYDDYFSRSRPDLIFGGAWRLPHGAAEKAGYTIVRNRDELQDLNGRTAKRVLGPFCPANFPYEWEYAQRIDTRYDDVPHLSEMTRAALDFLDQGDKGLFLMVEGGRIDHSSHKNHLPNMVLETLEFDNAVKEVMRWAAGRDDTLVLVTSDHECGGLKVVKHRGLGKFSEATWASVGHTKALVPVFAWGVGADRFAGKIDNTDVPGKVLGLPASAAGVDQKVFDQLIREY